MLDAPPHPVSAPQILAKKVYTLYSLAVQQLSRQDHYDFGLRALTSLLRYAGKKRRLQPDLSDEEVGQGHGPWGATSAVTGPVRPHRSFPGPVPGWDPRPPPPPTDFCPPCDLSCCRMCVVPAPELRPCASPPAPRPFGEEGPGENPGPSRSGPRLRLFPPRFCCSPCET